VHALDRRARAWTDVTPILYGHLGDGNVHVNLLDVPSEERHAVEAAVLDLVDEHGGSISAEHGIGRAKTASIGRTRSAEELALMRAVKAVFDPAHALGRGRVLPDPDAEEAR
jgi:FAD/FMN-containing dehydrogenase